MSNDQVLQATVKDIIASGNLKGKIYVDCSTVHPDTSQAVAREITEAGGQFVSGMCPFERICNPALPRTFAHRHTQTNTLSLAPVFGAAPVAAAGKLIFVIAGPPSATEAIAPYLKGVMGKSVIDMGADVSKSSLLKVAGNICVISFMEVISEAHVFAEKTGLGSPVLETMLGDMFGPVLESYSKRLTTGAYAPPPGGKAGFDVQLAIKDARHALSCATAVDASLDVSQVALGHMEQARTLCPDRPLDSSSMYGAIRTDSGLDFFTDLCKKRDSLI